MKKITLLFAAALTSFASFAQDNDSTTQTYDLEESTIYGINVGGNASVLNIDAPGYETSAATSFVVGLSMELGITDNLSFFGHFNYDRRMYKVDYTANYVGDEGEAVAINTKSTQTVNYVSVPVALRYYMGENRNFFVNAGGYVDIYLSGKAKVESGDTYNYGFADSGNKNAAFGVFPGLGYRLPLSKDNGDDLLFEFKYYIGLSDAFYGVDSKMNSAQLSVSYRIDWSDM